MNGLWTGRPLDPDGPSSAGGSAGLGRRLAWLLRHGARASGLAMDAAGWVAISEVVAALGADEGAVGAVVARDRKRRFELCDGRLRASQGHSLAGAPVTCEGLEASWREDLREADVWHGTRAELLPAIQREGLRPGQRTHVHLAPSVDSLVGKRAGVEVLIAVSPVRLREAGLALFASPNGVLLARSVPPACLGAVRRA